MLISIGLYVFNVVRAASARQLAMQSCVLCSFVRCGTSNQIERKNNNLKHITKKSQHAFILLNLYYIIIVKNY